MKKVDLVKLETAIKYVERIADGCNPVNNTPLEETDVLNNPNIIRCMYFIRYEMRLPLQTCRMLSGE